jgi:hypothetical protein
MPSDRLTIPQFDIRLYSDHWFALGTVALIAYLEELDIVSDVKGIEVVFMDGRVLSRSDSVASSNISHPVRFMDVMSLALLGIYGTGH